MKKMSKVCLPTLGSKVFVGATRGKLGNLTFGDINNLVRLLNKYKGPLPAGYSRKHCQACVVKTR